jgi:acetoin utilization protein AcuB
MTSPVRGIRGTTTLAEVLRHFSENRFRHYPVVDQGGKICGILSDRLAFKEALAHAPHPHTDWRQIPVETIMVTPVLTAAPHVSIREIARVLFEERIGCMPITNDTGEPIGIITRSDLLRAMVALASLELRI